MRYYPKLNTSLLKKIKNAVDIMNKSKIASVISPRKISTSNSKSVNHENYTFQELPKPTSSESDKKEYKVIQLKNGLIACLISDTEPISQDEELESSSECEESGTDESFSSEESDGTEDSVSMEDGCPKKSKLREQKMAAAGLCIGVGSFSDPKEVPGMAHFLEHMVFMGSEKYPEENSFDEFIKQNGGSDNASTDAETTVFYFECLEKYLEEALDRFSQFFITPLMKREAMTRERESIESEFQLSISSDSSRKEQLLCTLAKENSPVNSFPWGNLITLRDNIADEQLYEGVHEFRKRHYSAHRMTLAVQARLPLEVLEKYILNTFSMIPNNGIKPDDFSKFHGKVFDTPNFNKLYYVIPIKDICQVDIVWALSSLKNKYRSKPQHFLSYLLGDEGKGSLLSYLKKKLWVIGTNIGNSESGIEHNSLYTIFTINLNLTEEGYNNLSEVIEVIFSYLRMLKENGPQSRTFEEIQSIAYIGFKYAQEESAIDNVEDLCEAMQFYPPVDYISGSELYFEYDPGSIVKIIDELVPEKASFFVLRRDSEREGYQTEKWFGTQYLIKDIPESWMTKWKNAPINPELCIPPPNTFITKDFSILPVTKCNSLYPQKILDSPSLELWYRRDTKFMLPMAYYYIYLISPLSVKDATHLCMLDTLVNLLTIGIAEDIYPASSASLSHSFAAYEKGLIIKVWGFNEKLPILLHLIGKHLINLQNTTSEDMFEAIKDKLVKNYYNKLLKPNELAKDIRLNLLTNSNWLPVDRYLAMQKVSFEDIKTFSSQFFKTLFIKCLIQGNISQVKATEVMSEFSKNLNYSELKKEDIPVYEVVRVNKGEKCCRVMSFNTEDTNSVVTNYYQSDKYAIENSVIIDLIIMIIEEPLFDILRTKEQLGYHVFCSVRDTFGVLGYTITVNSQATKVTTKFVDERVESFLKYTQSLLANFSEEDFEKIKSNLIKMKKCSDVHLKEEVDRNWSEITSDDYIFDRIQQEIDAIQKTDLNKICSWWDSHNSFGNRENFRKLSIQVDGFKGKDLQNTPILKLQYFSSEDEALAKKDENYFISDINEFKTKLEIFNKK